MWPRRQSRKWHKTLPRNALRCGRLLPEPTASLVESDNGSCLRTTGECEKWTLTRSLLCPQRYPVRQIKFPVSWCRELAQKVLYYLCFLASRWISKPPNPQIPCKIPCLQGIYPETIAISTASPAGYSCVRPGFPRDTRIGRKSVLFAYSIWSLYSRLAGRETEIAESLRSCPQIFPFRGDFRRRPV